MVPVRIEAQLLRQLPAGANEFGAFALSEVAPPTGRDVAAVVRRWKQADVKRAIAAAQQAGLENYRVELSPDGTITIVVGSCSDVPAGEPGAA